MAYVAPTTLSTGCLVSAASWNQNVVNNILQIVASPLAFDFVNDRVGVNIAAPAVPLDVNAGSNQFAMGFQVSNSSSQNSLANFPVAVFSNSSSAVNVGTGLRFNCVDSGQTARTGAGVGAEKRAQAARTLQADS